MQGAAAKRLALYPGCPAQALSRANVLVPAAANTPSPKSNGANPASAPPPKGPASSSGPAGKPPKPPLKPAAVAAAPTGAIARETPPALRGVPVSTPPVTLAGPPGAQSPGSLQGESPVPYWEQTGMTEEEWDTGTLLSVEEDA